MTVLVIAEVDKNGLKSSVLNTVGAARKFDLPINLLLVGYQCESVVSSASKIEGISKVFYADAEQFDNPVAEDIADLIVPLTGICSHVLAAATSFGKNLLPRVAALLDVAQISDIVDIVAEDIFIRPIYAGNAMAKVRSKDKIKVVTVRATSFDAVGDVGGNAEIEKIDAKPAKGTSMVSGQELTKSERPELTSASVVVSGGRGMGSGENFDILEKLADKLGAAVGASRAAVDSGYVPNDYQVGQTGKVVAPELYIAVGISGAIQHLAGMKDSKIIVAVNKDAEAPIFNVADYGLVGDLFDVVPQITDSI